MQRTVRRRGRAAGGALEAPAESSHTGPRNEIVWLPPASYRRWRDVGVRGYDAGGLPDETFRGRFGCRNAAYTDLMVRTGLRLTEQSALTLFDVPAYDKALVNFRTRIPNAIAKAGSGRMVYMAGSVLRAVWDYIEVDRAEAVEDARGRGLYEAMPAALVVEDPDRPVVRVGGGRVEVSRLDPLERRRLLVRDRDGRLEPAALWLGERGLPMTGGGWQHVFKDANARCARRGVALRCHPHMLRHSFAVVTLEQLWRGHLVALGEMNPEQRQTYQMVFGDPLNWVRMRLGHRSVQTTQIYLHTLQELEMDTRLALVASDGAWEPAGWCPQGLAEGVAA